MKAGLLTAFAALSIPCGAHAQQTPSAEVDTLAAALEQKVIAWRRDIHQHPELGNREVRTAKLVAEHLQALGLRGARPVSRIPAWSALLQGGKPGPVVALRADMDALPVTEEVDLPFASKVRTQWNGEGGRRDARLRPRCACRHPDGRGRDPGADARSHCPAPSSSSSSRPRKDRRPARKAARS